MAVAKPCACPICDENFPSITKMHAHRKNCVLTCQECLKTFKSKQSLAKHSKATCGIPCSVCSMRFTTEFKRAEHMRENHEDKTPWKCADCPSQFERRDRLKRHVDEKHRGVKRKAEAIAGDFCCPCSYTTTRKLNWERHTKACPAHRIGARAFFHRAFNNSASSSTASLAERAIAVLRQTRDAALNAIMLKKAPEDEEEEEEPEF